MIFNIAQYFETLRRRFAAAGGTLVTRRFASRSHVLSLPERVIVNCMGYGARAIWGDETMVPVRGQVAHYTPQAARYALTFDAVQAISRRDALVVQYLGPNDDFGFEVSDETPSAAETAMAASRLKTLWL